MSIAKKILAIFLLMALFFVVINYSVQKAIVLPSFAEIERQNAIIDIQRIEEHLQTATGQLERLNYDWSAWDDTYQFVQDRSLNYINSNLASDTFLNFQTDIVLMTDMEHQLVWGNTYLFTEEQEVEVITTEDSMESIRRLFADLAASIDIEADDDDQLASGIVVYQDNLIIYSIRTILRSDGSGPPRGYFAFAKTLNELSFKKIKEQLKLDFEVSIVNQSDDARNLDKQYRVEYISDRFLTVSKTYFSNNQPIFTVSTAHLREITKSGLQSIDYAMLIFLSIAIASALVISVVLRVSVLKPLTNLTDRIQSVSKSKDYSLRTEVKGNDEVGIISRELNRMLANIEDSHKTLETMTRIDPLTKISNRLALDDKLEQEWNTLRRSHSSLSILMIDIDHFKLYNDNLGHQAGDDCLRKVAQTIKDCLKRASDIVARYGGEEFLVVLPAQETDSAVQVAQFIQQAIADADIEHQYNPITPRITLSIGIASIVPTEESSPDILIRQADAALYEAKQSGRNCIKIAQFAQA